MLKIFVISLRESGRRQAVKKQMEKFNLEFEFFDAIEGAKLNSDQQFNFLDRLLYNIHARRDPVPGEIGCASSHRSLWKLCIEINEPIVILEDDCKLLPAFAKSLEAAEEFIDRSRYIRLEGLCRKQNGLPRFGKNIEALDAHSGFNLVYVRNIPLCLRGYVISPAGAATLVAKSRHLIAPVDKFIQMSWLHTVAVKGLIPPCVDVLSVQSEIEYRGDKSANPALLAARFVFKCYSRIRQLLFDRIALKELRASNLR